jgi:nucleoside-diphosphate-sugar epimerase
MMQGRKVLVTGAAGLIGLPLVDHLVPDNEVWGISRFSDAASRQRVEAAGATTRSIDISSGDFGDLPDDFDYVIHLATYRGDSTDFDAALRTDAEGTALLLQHCRGARAALVMSAGAVYRRSEDPSHRYVEDDPLGEGLVPMLPAYSVSKIAQEAVARSCARLYDLPVVIARMNSAYGPNGGLVVRHLDAIMADRPLLIGAPGTKVNPIHTHDINLQSERLLAAAGVPATIVNWGGDDVVGPEDWCAYFAQLTGKDIDLEAATSGGGYPGAIYDSTKRLSITGPCEISWRDGMRALVETCYPGAIRPGG